MVGNEIKAGASAPDFSSFFEGAEARCVLCGKEIGTTEIPKVIDELGLDFLIKKNGIKEEDLTFSRGKVCEKCMERMKEFKNLIGKDEDDLVYMRYWKQANRFELLQKAKGMRIPLNFWEEERK